MATDESFTQDPINGSRTMRTIPFPRWDSIQLGIQAKCVVQLFTVLVVTHQHQFCMVWAVAHFAFGLQPIHKELIRETPLACTQTEFWDAILYHKISP